MLVTDGATKMYDDVFEKYNWPDRKVSPDFAFFSFRLKLSSPQMFFFWPFCLFCSSLASVIKVHFNTLHQPQLLSDVVRNWFLTSLQLSNVKSMSVWFFFFPICWFITTHFPLTRNKTWQINNFQGQCVHKWSIRSSVLHHRAAAAPLPGLSSGFEVICLVMFV